MRVARCGFMSFLGALRPRLLAASFALAAPLFAVGCTSETTPSTASDDVVTIPHTDAKTQSIGNCWLYATASWLEAEASPHMSA